MESTEEYINLVSHKPQKPTKFIFYKEHNIKLTDSAVVKINELRIANPDNILRVMINGGGCQGFQYEFLTDLICNVGQKSRDTLLYDEEKKPLIVFDLFSEFYIKNSKINYVSVFLEAGFKIEDNPQAQSSCGCKKSFASDVEFEGEIE
jgi:iron-sulfur cluster assembly accessory protein